MKTRIFCQSCCTPLDSIESFGTEADGSQSHDYCAHCYQNGSFTNPFATMNDMENHIRHLMGRHHEDAKAIYHAINILPELKRWQKPVKV